MNIRKIFNAILKKLGLKKTLMLSPGNSQKIALDNTSVPNSKEHNTQSAAGSFRKGMAFVTVSQTPDNVTSTYKESESPEQTTVSYADTTGVNTTAMTKATSSEQEYFGSQAASNVEARVAKLLEGVGQQPPRDDGVRS